MSTLGEILARLDDPVEVIALLTEAGDITVIADLSNAASISGRDPCQLALDAVQAFTQKANDEAWVKLIGRIQSTNSPGAACLSEMIAWSMTH